MARVEWYQERYTRKVRTALEDLSKETADKIADTMKRLVPVGDWERKPGAGWKERKPGTLRDSIRVSRSKYRGGGYVVVAGGYNAYYAKWVELGAPARSHEQWRAVGHAYPVPRQPFMRPALRKHSPGFVRNVQRALRE